MHKQGDIFKLNWSTRPYPMWKTKNPEIICKSIDLTYDSLQPQTTHIISIYPITSLILINMVHLFSNFYCNHR